MMKEGRDFDEIEDGDGKKLYTLKELLSEVEIEEGDNSGRSITEDDRDNLLREIHDELLTESERDELVRDISRVSKELHDTENIPRRPTFQDLDKNEVYRLYYGEKFSQGKVAEVLGCSRHVIQQVFLNQGWKTRSVGGVEKDIDPHEVYRICVEEGRPKKEAAEALGCKSTRPINRVLKENDWQTPLEQKMETEIDPDEVHRLHFEEGWSLKRIANHYGYVSKDVIQKMFREREWIPIGLARRIERLYEFPSEIEEEHRIELSRIRNSFDHLREKESISPMDMARCIEDIISSSAIESRVKWLKMQTEQDTKITDVLENRRLEVESSLNELLDISKDSNKKVRVGFIDGKLYIREQDISEHNWLNIYDNELFYFKSTIDKFKLVHEMRARLGLSKNTDLGKLIDQLTDREDADGSGYSDIKETTDEHLRAETLQLILDTTGQILSDNQDMIECIGKIRGGKYEGQGGIRNPRFPTDPEVIDMMFARFFGLGLSDGHLCATHSNFIYAENDRNRRAIVIQHSKDFGDVYYNEKEVDGEVRQIQFASAFGRALKKRGFPVGDKCFLNIGLPDFIKNGSLQTVCVYFSNMWPEDGCFVVTGSDNRGEFKWGRSVVVRNPSKELEYGHDKEVTDAHLAFLKEYGTYIKEDIDNDFKERIELASTTLEKLARSDNPRISSVANEIKDIVYDNQPKLLLDEIEVLRRIGIHATSRFIEIDYSIETSRVSIAWSGRIQRKTDVMRASLQMSPDDIRKSAKVREWMKLNPELIRQTEKEINQGRNGSSTHKGTTAR
ncbi:MAG: hypothetical protein AM326_07040 [Candidatus Thorarchaeota archaeon SMTZ-45]|nr:MAG: hypothetical protein AM326_07040 [Candidatus Thorarchaeota archaeon SMTZ-45]